MATIDRTYYQSMHEILEGIESKSSPREICCSILKDVTKATSSKGCSIMLFTPDKKDLFRCAAYGLSDWFFKKSTVSTDLSISEALEGKPVAILDATSDDRVGYRKQIKQEGIASILNIPVKSKENIIGVMQLYTSEPHQFTNDDISFASMVANFGADALDRAGYYEIVQKDYDAFKNSMRQMHSEFDFELCCEPDVLPVEEEGPVISAGG